MVAVRKIISQISSKLNTKSLRKCDHSSHFLTTTASKRKSLTNKITFRKKLSNIFNWNALVSCKDDFLHTLKKPRQKLIFNHLSEIKMPLHYNGKGKNILFWNDRFFDPNRWDNDLEEYYKGENTLLYQRVFLGYIEERNYFEFLC